MSRRINMKAAVTAAWVLVSIFAINSPALAMHVGYVTGTWSFLNRNGNYCPSTNSCVGARYLQSQYNTHLPIANARVHVLDAATDTLIGAGATDSSGKYTIVWVGVAKPAQIRVRVSPYHSAGRFYFADPNGTLIYNATPAISVTTSSSTTPQNIGGWIAGSATSPQPYYNSYWAAERLWRDVLSKVGSATTNFTNIEIRGFADTMFGSAGTAGGGNGTCSTSCAHGPTKRVQLDAAAAYSPQARIMHELGHIYSYVSHPWKLTGDYTWAPAGSPAGASNWSQGSAEWGVSAFEEAFATHPGSVAFWWSNATTPTTCLSAVHCYTSTGVPNANTNIEATSYAYSTDNCDASTTNPEGRRPISAMRFFWDVFDSHNDADGDDYSAANGDYWKHLALLAFYPDGRGTDQINEPWDATGIVLTERDGRGSTSYRNNYEANIRNVYTLWVDNCSPF